MDIIYIIYLLKSISIITVVILAYYSLRNAFFMVGAIGRQIMALGVILFLITDIINSIDLIMFSERKIHIISFIIWFVALSTYTTGGFITGKKLQKAYSSSLIQVSMKHPGSIYVLCGVLILIFFGIPFFLVDVIYHESNTSCWLCIVNSVIWIFAYINLILGASIYYSSGIKSGLNKKETIPIREDIFVARAYSNIINTFLSSTKPITGAFKEAIAEFLEYNPILFENCMINPDGTLELSCIEKNVERIHKENRINDICLIFSSLGSTLLRVYSAITSQKWAADVLANSFTKVKDIYGETPLMFDILRSFPEEFLQDERFALLPRKELEARIRERTRELEESKNYINNIVRSMTDLLIVVDPDGKIRTTNKATRDLLGFKDGELSGQPVDIIFGSENARRFKNIDFNELILKGSIRYVERNYIHKNGDNVPVLSSYSLMWDEKNDIQGIVCVAQDITERKQAAERERIYLSNIKFLYETTMGFVKLPPEDNIYHFIGAKLEELVGDSNIAITSYNEKSDLFKIRCIIGKGKYSRSVLESIEDETEEMYIKVSQEIKDALSRGKIVSYPWYIINEVDITDKVRENLVKFNDEINIHSIGFISEGKLLGSAIIIANDNIIFGKKDIIETFINQSAVSLKRRLAEDQTKASLKEKEVLLKEIHHRVKNNLQIISSLLSLQSGYIDNDQALSMFNESKNRVKSMALIHEKLYQSETLASIDFAGYIQDLAEYLLRMYGAASQGIRLSVDVRNVSLDIDTAIPCGLIINELVSNSLKYAFPKDRKNNTENIIKIELYEYDNNQLMLSIGDNGIGFPEEVDFQDTDSLGLQLVNTLTEQLDGSIKLDGIGGTKFSIDFPDPNKTRSE